MEARDATLRAEHLAESVRRLPGPAYYKVLKSIHQILQPSNYLEIGVHLGVSLHQANRDTPCVIGVDPSPNILPQIQRQLPVSAASIYELTSDEFFARGDLRDLLGGPVELAFIDGLHLFEQVLQDFVNVERDSTACTVVLLHDCLPFDEATASRERTTDFYSGDVWKAVLALRRQRPELEMAIVPTAPTGLCLVRGLDRDNRGFEAALPEIVATYRELVFDYYTAHREEMPHEIPNREEALRSWLAPSGSGDAH